uniref:Four and a half LIM domains protein 2 n=1 Tax=Panagrellus redivivus TaxID=6233 RepID=A0A7E4UY03_PANRE
MAVHFIITVLRLPYALTFVSRVILPDSQVDSSKSTSSSAAASDNMAMIATVHPYNRDNTSSSGFKIEDVTDDPKYQDDDEGELEGALVEYCRIDHREQKPAHNVCEAATVVSARGINNNDKLLSFTPSTPAAWKSSTASAVGTPRMANIIDVDVGSICSASNQCKCFGFRPHQWRKVCVHCKCDRSEHEIGPNQVLSVYERLGIKPTDEMAAVMKTSSRDTPGSVSHGYAWVPPGLTRVKVEEFFSQYPNHVIPRLNSLGEKYREKQLMIQLPRQDLSIAYCKHLRTPVERRIYEEFVNARNEISLDIGFVCPSLPKSAECKKCRGVLEKGDIAVTASKMGEDAVWHPACFICATCEQLLVDLTYCAREDKIFCERHYAELHKPRCSACDELIFAGEYTKAMNKDWHSDHFCCWNCDTTLTGQRYILRDDHPFCIKCYEDVFANTCDECTKPIGIDSKDLSYKDKHWHEDCFLCNMCKISLVDKPFGSKNDRIFCSNCYDNAFATRCDGCNEIFRAGMKKMEYKGKQWHDKCFCCATCKVPIGTKSFIPKNEEVYCANCYEDKFATRCTKCKKVISTGGVTYKNEPWHRECFCCTNCSSSLAGQRFTSKDDKPYCANCYGDLFAKRCNACVKPITGIGGAKFISFEDRHWHNDCFICAQCTTSLVGKGFITDGADILCPECAKARLMAAHS